MNKLKECKRGRAIDAGCSGCTDTAADTHKRAMAVDYSFHCTPCGKSHAGECPPKFERKAVPVAVDIGVATQGPPSYSISASPWMSPGVPQLGSRWITEKFNAKAGVWKQVHPEVYVVDAHVNGKVIIKDNHGLSYSYDLDAWKDQGVGGGPATNDRAWRFVEAP